MWRGMCGQDARDFLSPPPSVWAPGGRAVSQDVLRWSCLGVDPPRDSTPSWPCCTSQDVFVVWARPLWAGLDGVWLLWEGRVQVPSVPEGCTSGEKGPPGGCSLCHEMPGPPEPATYPRGVPGNPLWMEGAAPVPGATPWVLSTLPGAGCERPLCLDYRGQVPALIGGVCFLLFFVVVSQL